MKSIRFGVMTDLHHCNEDIFLNRYFRNTLKKIEAAAKVFNSNELDFIVNLGDTIDRGFENFEAITDAFKSFNAPLYTILGNHDFNVEDNQKNLVAQQLQLSENYYEVIANGFQLLFLDGNEVSTYANNDSSANHQKAIELMNKLQEEGAPNGGDYNGGMSEKQLGWLESKLSEAAKNKLLSIVFCHFPIFPDDKHNLLNNKEVISIIIEFKHVIAWICGHNHDGNFSRINQCHVINLKGLVETEHENAFSIFEINDQQMKVTGFGREIDRVLKI